MTWSTAVPDWERRIVAGESLVPLEPLFPKEAEEALNVFKALRVVDVPGMPTFGECSEPWVFEFVAVIFGACDSGPEYRRRITEFFLLISKKNGKSTIAAGIMLTALILNWRLSAELLLLAPTIEIAKNAWQPLVDMIRADEELTRLLHPQENFRQVKHRVTGAVLKVVAADSDVVGGKKASFVLVDELWLFGKRDKAGPMLMEATGGLVARPEGFVIYLSTQSDEQPAGVFKDRLNLFRDIRDGKINDPKKFGVLFEFPPAMVDAEAYLDPANFYITNPNLGRSVSGEWLAEKLEENRRKEKSELNVWLSKHLNVEIGMRLRADRWPGADHWQPAAEPGLTLDALLERCDVVVMGGDGGGLDDLLGIAVLGREKVTRKWLLWCHGWCYAKVLERRKEIAPKLRDLQLAGELTIVDTLGEDMKAVTEIARKVRASGKAPAKNAIGVDPAGLGGLVDAFIMAGFTAEQIIGISQGWKLGGAILTTERALADGTMRHAGQALMTWCVDNAKIEPKGNAKLITKQAAGIAKIDPLMATFDAVSLMSMNPAPRGVARITLIG